MNHMLNIVANGVEKFVFLTDLSNILFTSSNFTDRDKEINISKNVSIGLERVF